MRTIAARRLLPGATVAEAERLWLDLARWPAFVDGFGTLAINAGIPILVVWLRPYSPAAAGKSVGCRC